MLDIYSHKLVHHCNISDSALFHMVSLEISETACLKQISIANSEVDIPLYVS